MIWKVLIHNSALHPAKEAYERAVKLFGTQLTKDEEKRKWLLDKHSIEDVQNAVLQAKTTYELKPRRVKLRQHLAKLSSRLMYYSSIMDMLAQHHPEYTSLAWGAMKLVLVVSSLVVVNRKIEIRQENLLISVGFYQPR